MADGSSYTTAAFLEKWEAIKRESAALEGPSLADRLALCEAEEPGFIGSLLDALGPSGCLMLAYDFRFWGRPKQLAPLGRANAWRILLHVAGRGTGKTRAAAEWLVSRLQVGARVIVLVGPNEDDIREFMIGGQKKRVDAANGSGLLDVLPPWIRAEFKVDAGVIEFPDFKATARIHSAEVAEYRGPEPDTVWGDEVLKWRYPEKLLSNLRLACRAVGRLAPQIYLTSSPKRLKVLRDLVMDDDVWTIHSATRENRGNVDERWFASETRRLGGTRQGAEELGGELSVDDGSELFPLTTIDRHRVGEAPEIYSRVVVSVDPSGSVERRSDDAGIAVCGRVGDIHTGEGYVIADATKRRTWDEWGDEVIRLAELHGASAIVLERNKFADAVAANVRTAAAKRGWEAQARPGSKHLVDLVHKSTLRRVQIIEVLAMGDKASRAGPVSTLYEKGRVHHVGTLTRLESEMSDWDPSSSESPNGMDAVVHAFTELFALDRPPTTSGAAAMKGMTAANDELAKASGRFIPVPASWLSGGERRDRSL